MNNHLRLFASLCERGKRVAEKVIIADIESSKEFQDEEDSVREKWDYINGIQYNFLDQMDNLRDIVGSLEEMYTHYYLGRAASDDWDEEGKEDKKEE